MNEHGIWKTIKIGFWLGVGFIIPLVAVIYGGGFLTFVAMSPSNSGTGLESQIDGKKHIEIDSFEDKTKDDQLLILGSLTNKSSKTARSIQLEAELFDDNDKFVYECTEYISEDVMPGESENFQIKCGCRDSQLPIYSSIKIRVMSAVVL